MQDREFTLDDLRRLLRGAAGEADGVDLDGDILDLGFAELGYESLALMETGSRIERELGLRLEDGATAEAPTPRALIELVNEALSAARAA